jgi:Domain of unknown function (DUF4189)
VKIFLVNPAGRIKMVGAAMLAISLTGSVSAETAIMSYCSSTKSFGFSSGDDVSKATERSLRHCNASGGDRVVGCCTVVGSVEAGCIALAVGPSGKQGTETGGTQMEAISAAVEACPESGCVAKVAKCVE